MIVYLVIFVFETHAMFTYAHRSFTGVFTSQGIVQVVIEMS